LAGKIFELPQSISFHTEIENPEHGHVYTADVYSQVIRMVATLWATATNDKTGRVEYYYSSQKASGDDAAAISGLYLGLARVQQGLRPICVYPGSGKTIASAKHPIKKVKEFMAEVTGDWYEALKTNYKVEEHLLFEHLLRSTPVNLSTGAYFKRPGDSAKKASTAMGRLHRMQDRSNMKEAFKEYTVEGNTALTGQKGLKALREINKDERFAIVSRVFAVYDPNFNQDKVAEYYWDLSHDTILRC
jgi:hypothetical protein